MKLKFGLGLKAGSAIFLTLVILALSIFGLPYIVQAIYNYMIPKLYPKIVEGNWIAGHITYWVAFCIVLLPSLGWFSRNLTK